MNVQNVTEADGIHCIQLIAFLQKGTWNMTGADSDKLQEVKLWVRDISGKMAKQLAGLKDAPASVSAPVPAMKVKAMGPMNTSGSPRKKK